MQNRMQYYERVYEKVQDVLSDVGGLCSIVLTIAELINILVNYYVTLFDTQTYMNEIDNSKNFDKNIFKMNYGMIKIRSNNNKSSPPKSKMHMNNLNNEESLRNSIISKVSKDDVNIYDKKRKTIRSKSKKNNISIKKHLKKSFLLNSITINNAINNSNAGQSIVFKDNTKKKMKDKNESGDDNIVNNINVERDKKYVETKESNIINNDKYKLKFINYLKYFLSLNKRHSYMQVYEYFRKRMISEENLILNHLNIEKILKKEKIEKINDESEKINI
jgi:hypothetical protein